MHASTAQEKGGGKRTTNFANNQRRVLERRHFGLLHRLRCRRVSTTAFKEAPPKLLQNQRDKHKETNAKRQTLAAPAKPSQGPPLAALEFGRVSAHCILLRECRRVKEQQVLVEQRPTLCVSHPRPKRSRPLGRRPAPPGCFVDRAAKGPFRACGCTRNSKRKGGSLRWPPSVRLVARRTRRQSGLAPEPRRKPTPKQI